MASKRFSFEGQLRESPLRVRLHRDLIDGGKLDPESPIHFNIDWGAWEGQSLLTLPYFEDIRRFLHADTFTVKCLAKGNDAGRVDMVAGSVETRKLARAAIDWIDRCRAAAKYLGVNPPFPFSDKVKILPKDDVEVLVELIESGVHEQSHVGQTICFESDPSSNLETLINKPRLNIQQAGQVFTFDFFGTKILLGPVTFFLSEVELTTVTGLANNRVELAFKGGPGSIWRMAYQRHKESSDG
jgi:hypothetical protein